MLYFSYMESIALLGVVFFSVFLIVMVFGLPIFVYREAKKEQKIGSGTRPSLIAFISSLPLAFVHLGLDIRVINLLNIDASTWGLYRYPLSVFFSAIVYFLIKKHIYSRSTFPKPEHWLLKYLLFFWLGLLLILPFAINPN